MKVLVGYVVASLVGAFLVVRIFEYIVGERLGNAAVSAAKAGLFATTWTAITAGLGMRGFAKRGRGLRLKTKSVNRWLHTRR